ncbi:hypothetical protein WJX73_010125 [Symbiochloris irregularis]|uniref:UspA domain-containing protein n=1 Tax=Symbiochloris irregularis TaxID=706552 RepID=A0AAW1PRQ6_9CHLO
MQQIRESEELDLPLEIRKLLVAVDDADECVRALTWCMENLYRDGDEIHLLHVVPRLQRSSSFGRPPIDFLPQQDPVTHDQLVKKAELFIRERFLPKLQGLHPEPVVHIVKCEVDTASIGNLA